MNTVQLMGRLTADPEIRYTQSAEPVAIAKFTLAVPRRKVRDKPQETDFFNVITWRNKAEFAERYLRKGQRIAIVGVLQARSYDDKDKIKRWVVEVVAEDIYFADAKTDSPAQQHQTPDGFEDIPDSGDLPF
jgi:single-strand DNA-binding protein